MSALLNEQAKGVYIIAATPFLERRHRHHNPWYDGGSTEINAGRIASRYEPCY